MPDNTEALVAVPSTIHTQNGDGSFEVKELEAWTQTPQGVFATGIWSTTAFKSSVLIPWSNIRYIEFDFDALRTILEESVPGNDAAQN